MSFFKNVLRRLNPYDNMRGIEKALALHRRSEVRPDGLTLIRATNRLEIEWRAREIHPWDRGREHSEHELQFTERSFADTDAALSRLFIALPEIDVIDFRVIHPRSDIRILAGTVERSAPVSSTHSLSPRSRLWRRGVTILLLAIVALVLLSSTSLAQTRTPAPSPGAEDSSTSTDLFVMIGSDFDRPGLLPRANYNIGIGHTFGFLKKDPFGDELTFAYTYENSGSHGFLHTDFGEHTEQVGLMKNFSLPKTKVLTGYTWIQEGITSYTGHSKVQNRLDTGLSLGAIVHINNNSSIWIQETYSKVVTVPWYTTSSIGYTCSW